MYPSDRMIEEKITAAKVGGEVEKFPGKGHPLPLLDDPYKLEDSGLTNKILQKNGLDLPWKKWRGETESEVRKANQPTLRSLKEACNPQESETANRMSMSPIDAHNRKIFQYNLQMQSPLLERRKSFPQVESQRLMVDAPNPGKGG